jgi:hypothetical protein
MTYFGSLELDHIMNLANNTSNWPPDRMFHNSVNFHLNFETLDLETSIDNKKYIVEIIFFQNLIQDGATSYCFIISVIVVISQPILTYKPILDLRN